MSFISFIVNRKAKSRPLSKETDVGKVDGKVEGLNICESELGIAIFVSCQDNLL